MKSLKRLLVNEVSLLLAGILMKVSMMAPASGQIPFGSCTTSMITSFAPCLSYLTGSGSGSPTGDCCKALGDLITSSSDCGCLMLSGGVPFSLPINRSLAVSLPQFCQSGSVPLSQCKGMNFLFIFL